MTNKLITKSQFAKIKKYNLQQMNNFCISMYHTGFEDGVDAGSKADLKILLYKIIEDTKGIGPILRKRLLENYNRLK